MPSASFLRFSESSGRDRGRNAPLKRPDQVSRSSESPFFWGQFPASSFKIGRIFRRDHTRLFAKSKDRSS